METNSRLLLYSQSQGDVYLPHLKKYEKEVWCSAKWSQERNGCSRSTFPTMKDNMLYATYLKLKYASILQLYYMHIKDGSPHLHSSKTLLRLLLLCIIHLFYYNSF